MKNTIRFDYDIAETAAKGLEQEATRLEKEVRKMERNDAFLIRSAWDSDSGACYRERYLELAEEFRKVSKELLLESEKIKKAARQFYIAEQEAKRIASQSGE